MWRRWSECHTRFSRRSDNAPSLQRPWSNAGSRRPNNGDSRAGLCTIPFVREYFPILRFLAIAQAWEIIGREISSHLSHDKSLFAKACDEAGQALERYLGQATAYRLKGMLKSNNRPSFRTLVEECLKVAPPYAVSLLCGDAAKFSRIVAKTRNALTHLQADNDDNFDLNRASRLSLYLTYKLTVLFCILEAQWLKLPLDNLATMLANNDMAIGAQRPLPD